MSEKKATVRDIAQRLGISLSTVNKALTGKTGISEKRRAEVIAAAKEMGYRVNHAAQSLSRKPIKLGVIIPAVWPQYFKAVEDGIEKELKNLSQSNVTGEICRVKSSDEIGAAISHFCDQGVHLILYCPSLFTWDLQWDQLLESKKIPVFTVGDECIAPKHVCSIAINAALSGKLAADFLNLLVKKGNSVAVFTGSGTMQSHTEKAAAFTHRANELGLHSVGTYETFDRPETAVQKTRKLLETHPNVKGIYVATAIAPAIAQELCNLPKQSRPYLVATDSYDDVRAQMEQGNIAATIFQNQVLMGRLAVKMAYRYLLGITSYREFEEPFSKKVCINPHLYLPSNLEEPCFEDGNDYILQ